MRDPRLQKLADVLVNYSVAVKPDQLVRINGTPNATPLIREVYHHVLAAGGFPYVHCAPEDLGEVLLKHATEKQLTFVNPIAVFEYERMDASIGIWADH